MNKYKLKVKYLPIETGGPFIVVINEELAEKLALHPADRVTVKYGDKDLVAVIDVSKKLVQDEEIGVFHEVKEYLGVSDGEIVEIIPEEPPASLSYIKKKLENNKLNKDEIYKIIEDITEDRLSAEEIAMWVVTTYTREFDIDEITWITEAVAYSGDVIEWDSEPILDKHCIGGVPNNRTTPIVVPIIASLGYKIPKTSSRSITSPAGTADVMEVFANVKLSIEEIKRIVNKVNGVFAWGGALNIAPADSKMIRARYPLRLDPLPLLLASILGKKKAVGSTHVIIDIPYGFGAKVESKRKAKWLGRYFEIIGKRIGMKIKSLYTDGSHPIGNGTGPVLEAIDILRILQQKNPPKDLEEKGISLASELLSLVGVKNSFEIAKKALKSGKAYEKFKEIIREQGGNENVKIEDLKSLLGQYTYDVVAQEDGKVTKIFNKQIAKIAITLGSPKDKGAGVYLYKKVGDKIKKGERIMRLYAEAEYKIDEALKIIEEFGTGYEIS